MNEIYILRQPYYSDSSGSLPQQLIKNASSSSSLCFVFAVRIWEEVRCLTIPFFEDVDDAALGDVVEGPVHLLEDLGVDVFLLLMMCRTPSRPIILFQFGENLTDRIEGRRVVCVGKESVLALRELLYSPR
jgi:hypothetical protein